MADNRNTVKSNITTLNVPTVTNAIMDEILNDNLVDNVAFKADYAVPIKHEITGQTILDFSEVDRIDLTCTGTDVGISVSGMSDGEVKCVRIIKTGGPTGNDVLLS